MTEPTRDEVIDGLTAKIEALRAVLSEARDYVEDSRNVELLARIDAALGGGP